MQVSDAAPRTAAAELQELDELVALGHARARGAGFEARVLAQVRDAGGAWPVWGITLGNPDPAAAAVGFFGGVHGLERIGAAVVIAWLRQLLMRWPWDAALRAVLARTRLVLMPAVNPAGLARGTRANPAGVDLMRNAPVDADAPVPCLLGGHRLGPALPWYRGAAGAPLQAEAAALCALVEREFAGRPLAMAVDCHSGFGLRDRVWFPHARTRAPTRVLPELHALTALYERCHPHHAYRFEPQSTQYLAHGDLWDHLHARIDSDAHPFLPMTLEMGSWRWVKKDPRQLFSRLGLFNPGREHRHRRVLRRHLPWFEFLLHAAASHDAWMPAGAQRDAHRRRALARWYGAAA